MRKGLLILGVVLMLLGCTGKQSSEGKNIRVAYIMEQLTEGITRNVAIMNDAINTFNASQTEFHVQPLEPFSADYELSNQIAQIEDAIVKDFDIIIIQALDNNAVLPYLKRATDAGIIVIDAQGDLAGDNMIHVLACDHYSQGQVLKESLKARLEANPALVLNAGIVWHEQSVTAAIPRMYCMTELAKEMPDRVKIIPGAQVYTNETAIAQNAMEDWLQAHPEINYVGCSMDESALGVINAIKSSRIKPGVIGVGSVDGSQTGCDLLAEGYMTDLVGISPREISQSRMDAAFAALQGKLKAGETYKGTYMVLLNGYTKDQIDAYLKSEGWL